jgi:hypothetical protein
MGIKVANSIQKKNVILSGTQWSEESLTAFATEFPTGTVWSSYGEKTVTTSGRLATLMQ